MSRMNKWHKARDLLLLEIVLERAAGLAAGEQALVLGGPMAACAELAVEYMADMRFC